MIMIQMDKWTNGMEEDTSLSWLAIYIKSSRVLSFH